MKGGNGEAYTVANGTDTTWRQFFSIFLRRLGKRQRVYTPTSVAYVVAFILQTLHAVVPSFEAKLTSYRIHRITTDTSYDISATVRDLGYAPVQDTERQVNAICGLVPGGEGLRLPSRAHEREEVRLVRLLIDQLAAIAAQFRDPSVALFSILAVSFTLLASFLNYRNLKKRFASDYPALLTYFGCFFLLLFAVPLAYLMLVGRAGR